VCQRQHHRHHRVAERFEPVAEPGSRIRPGGRLDARPRFGQVVEEVALLVVGEVGESPEEHKGADAEGELEQVGDPRVPPGRVDQRPEREQAERRQCQQRHRVHQVADPDEEAGLQRPPFDQRDRGEEHEGGGQQLRPGEPGFVQEKRGGRGEQDAEAGRAWAGEPPDERPEGQQGGAGEGRHRDPEGHEPARVEGLPGEFGDFRRRPPAREQDDGRGGDSGQRAAAREVVGGEVGGTELVVGIVAAGDKLGDVEGNPAVGPGADLEGAGDAAGEELSLGAQEPEGACDREAEQAADDHQGDALLGIEQSLRAGPRQGDEEGGKYRGRQ